jgi:ribonuclease inhibitor
MDDRREAIEIDLSAVTSSVELHDLLSRSLDFPDFYGRNWDAFWDAITGLVAMPYHLRIRGWQTLLERLPKDAAKMRSCLDRMVKQYPESASSVEYS